MSLAYRLFGNENLAALYRGEAMRLLFLVKQQLKASGLDFGALHRSYPDGTEIYARSLFGQELIEIIAGGGVEKKKKLTQKWAIFLFYEETKFRLYQVAQGKDGKLIEDVTPKTGNFPLPHTWYGSYLNPDKDPTPAVISKSTNDFHYINTVVDPLTSWAGNGYEDWHFHDFQFLFDWMSDSAVRSAPAIQPGLGMVHVSISPYTAATGFHLRQGGINQLDRQYNAEKSLVPLLTNGNIVETEVVNSGPGAFGRKGMTLGAQVATSWKERVFPSGGGTLTINSNLGTNIWLAWFLFPWIPYLPEISSFPILDFGTIWGMKSIHPTIRPPASFNLGYIDGAGAHQTMSLNDTAAFVYNQGTYNSVPADFYPIYHVVPGGPGGWYMEGSWVHASGLFSFTLTSSGTKDDSGTFRGTYYSPVGSVGNQDILKIQNDFALTQAYARRDSSTYSKATNMPVHYYVLWSGIEEAWLANGDYSDTSSSSFSNSITEARSLTITQKLIYRGITIETLYSTLTYDYASLDEASGSVHWTFHQWSLLPLPIWDSYYIHPPGSATRTGTESATAVRNTQSVEVLDFDSYKKGTVNIFICFYKIITVTHRQENTSLRSGASAPEGPSRDATGGVPLPGLGPASEAFTVRGTRLVEYYLYSRINSEVRREKLTEFTSTVRGDGSTLTHTASGHRVYGVSCQASPDAIIYHYLLEGYAGTPSDSTYDSPKNWEDYSYSGTVRQWTPEKIAVGLIVAGSRTHKEFDPEADPVIYSVGLHKEPEREEEE